MSSAFRIDEFELMVTEYQTGLNGFVRRLTRNREDAEEIVQDTFMRAYRALNAMSLQERCRLRLRAWLYTIARNSALNYLQKKRPSCVSIDSVEAVVSQLPQLVEHETPETIVIGRAVLEEFEDTLRQLPRHLREAARLRFIEDQSQSQIAQAFGQPMGTVKSHLYRAIVSMRRAYEGEAA